MLRLTAAPREHQADMPLGCVRIGASDLVDQRIDLVPSYQFSLLLHQSQLQHLGLDFDVVSDGLVTRRWSSLASQESRIGAALVDREAVSLPLDDAFSFELVGAAAIEVQCQCRRADNGCGLSKSWSRGGQRIVGDGLNQRVFVPEASRQDTPIAASG
ncbi:hypothetical protein [Bradyrhizobium sp. USDA 10063]